MLTYGKVFDKEIFIVEYEKNFHGNFITHFINQHKHFVQSTLKYFYADWKTAELGAEHDRNHVESILFYNQSKEPPESLLFGESFDVALNQDITIDTTYRKHGCPFNLLNPGAKKMCGSFADHGIDYAKTNYNIEHDYKVILITTSYFLSLSIPKAKYPSLETLTFVLSIITFEFGSVLPIIKCP